MSGVTSYRQHFPDKTPAQIAEEQVRCYELRLLGHSIRAVAEIMTANGYPMSHGTVDNRVKAEIKLRVEPLAEEVRQMEMDRFDRYLDKLKKKIDLGDEKAINAAIRISESRRKMLGVDAPERVDMRLSAADKELDSHLGSIADNETDDTSIIDGEWSDDPSAS